MEKRNKIIYWIFTVWMSLGWLSIGIVQLLKMDDEVNRITALGFPVYILPLLGLCKLLGVVVALLPGYPRLKEWVYAGFFFNLAGALYAHIMMGDSLGDMVQAFLMLTLTALSWYFRPDNRKMPVADAN